MDDTTPVRSPCVFVCSLGDDDICIGCHRSGAEITEWGRVSNERRRAILRQCETRARAQGVWMNVGTTEG